MRRLLVLGLFVAGCGARSGLGPSPGTAPAFRGAYVFSLAPSSSCAPGFGGTLAWAVTATAGPDGLAVLADSTQQLQAHLVAAGGAVSGIVYAVSGATAQIPSGAFIQPGELAGALDVAADGRAQVRSGTGTFGGAIDVGDARCRAADHVWSLREK